MKKCIFVLCLNLITWSSFAAENLSRKSFTLMRDLVPTDIFEVKEKEHVIYFEELNDCYFKLDRYVKKETLPLDKIFKAGTVFIIERVYNQNKNFPVENILDNFPTGEVRMIFKSNNSEVKGYISCHDKTNEKNNSLKPRALDIFYHNIK